MSEKIGFVGVGRMGANMARRLKEQNFNVTAVFDVNTPAAQSLAEEIGARHCAKLPEVTKHSDIIITVVTDDKAMKSIFNGSGSLLARSKGRLFINCATISPATHIKVEEWATKHEAQTLEACMASSITQARNGTLYLMCAGAEEAFARSEPVLNALSITNSAAKLKALLNMVMNINTAGLAEGLGLAEAMNLDLDVVREVFSQTGANSRVLETDGEDMVIKDHECYFSAAHAAKDSGIALKLADEEKLKLPLAKAAYKQYEKMTELGLGHLDKSGIAELTFKGRTLHSN